MQTSKVPKIEETRAVILAKYDEEWLEEQLEKVAKKYRGANFGDDFLHWMIAQQAGLEVADIKASADGGEGEEVVIFQLEGMLEDEDVTDGWTEVRGGKFEQPKSQAKYQLPAAVVLDIIEGVTSKVTPKMDLVVSDGTGTCKVVAYSRAVDLIAEAKVRKGDVIRLPLLNGQYGHWTKKTAQGSEQVLWYKLALPPFGSVHRLDAPATDYLKHLDQVVVRPGDACYVDGVITSIDQKKKDICSECRRWYDEEKEEEHEDCGDSGIVEEVTYEGTLTSTSGQIHRLFFPEAHGKPRIKVADDLVRVMGIRNKNPNAGQAVRVSVVKVIDGEESAAATEKAQEPPKAQVKARKAAEPAQESKEEEAVEEAPRRPRRRRSEDEGDGEALQEAKAGARRVRRRQKDMGLAEEDPEEDDGDGPEEEEEAVPKPRRRRRKAPESEEVDEADEGPAPRGASDLDPEVGGFVKEALTNFGGPQRWLLIARGACKQGVVKCGDLTDNEAIKAAFRPHLDAAVEAGLVKWVDADQKKIGLVD